MVKTCTHIVIPKYCSNKVIKFQTLISKFAGRGRMICSFLIFGARREWVVNTAPQPLFPWERVTAPIVQEAGWAPGPV